jgi:HPt (histidine-containing phosphotransfer) domain-containing protein
VRGASKSRSAEWVAVDEDVVDLAKRFLNRQRRAVKGLWVAMQQSDFDRIRRAGHDLKGSGGAYGLEGLSRIGSELEAAAGARNGSLIEPLLVRLKEQLACIELRTVMAERS